MFNRYQALSKPERRAFWIMMAMAIAFAIFAGALIDTLIGAPNLQYFIANILPFILTATALVSSILFLTGRVTAGSWLIQVGSIISLTIAVTQAEGYSFPAAFIILAITIYIPFQTLKGNLAYVSLWLGVAAAMGAILLGEFWTGSRIPALAQDVMSAAILSIVLALILFISTVTQFTSFAIRNKLLILALGTGLLSILPVAVLTTISTQQALTSETRGSLVSAAKHIVTEIDGFIGYNIETVSAEARLPEIVDYLNASPQGQVITRKRILALLNTLVERDPENIGSYALLNSEGIDIVDTYTDDIGVDKSDRDYFLQPRRTGRPFVSPVRY